jgi:hypothetical protein
MEPVSQQRSGGRRPIWRTRTLLQADTTGFNKLVGVYSVGPTIPFPAVRVPPAEKKPLPVMIPNLEVKAPAAAEARREDNGNPIHWLRPPSENGGDNEAIAKVMDAVHRIATTMAISKRLRERLMLVQQFLEAATASGTEP